MALPSGPVELSIEQIGELNNKLSDMRHDVNNNISLIVAAVEVMRMKPQMTESLMETISAQPMKISDRIARFSAEFEKMLHIRRG